MRRKIGVVGLGIMGKPMSINLLNAGFLVTVFDVKPDPIKELVHLGAKRAVSLKELGKNSDVVFLMVFDFNQIKDCISNKGNNLLEGMKKGSTLIITSTIAPSEAKEVAVIASKYGVNVLDSPVTGGRKGSENGTLTMIVSGSDEVFEDCKEALYVIGSNIKKVGNEIGLGQVVKSTIQLLVSVNLLAISEALVLGTKAGANPNVLYDVISESAGNSLQFEERAPSILKNDFSNSGALELLVKDLGICIELAKENNAPLFTSSIAHNIYVSADNSGLGKEDACSVIKLLEGIAGIEVRQ